MKKWMVQLRNGMILELEAELYCIAAEIAKQRGYDFISIEEKQTRTTKERR